MTENHSKPSRKLTILAIGLTLLAIFALFIQAGRDAMPRTPYFSAFRTAVSVSLYGHNKSLRQNTELDFLALLKNTEESDAPLACDEVKVMNQSSWQDEKHQLHRFPKFSALTRGLPRHWIFEIIPIFSTKFSVAIIGNFDIHRIIDEKTLRFRADILDQMIKGRDRGYEWGINSRIAPLDFKILSRRKCDGFVIYDLVAR